MHEIKLNGENITSSLRCTLYRWSQHIVAGGGLCMPTDRIKLNPHAYPTPTLPIQTNPQLKSKPPTKRSIKCGNFSENIF